jgi:serine/threonine-protein phosphatase 5
MEAVRDASRAIFLDPTNDVAMMERAKIRLSLGNSDGSLRDFLEVIRMGSPFALAARREVDKLLARERSAPPRPEPPPAAAKSVAKVALPISDLRIDFDNFTYDMALAVTEELRSGKMFPWDVVLQFLLKIRSLHESLPNIVNIPKPPSDQVIKIVGDTHGQFQDLLYIFDTYGFPSSSNLYLFNGDYVDRGSQGLEILLTIFAWKIANPDAIFLNRGNQYVFFCTFR